MFGPMAVALVPHVDTFGDLTRTWEVTRHPLSHKERPLLTLLTYKWVDSKSSVKRRCLSNTVPQ